jgi:multiple sugar transport system permease protein
MGYASAMAWLLFIVTLTITLLLFRTARRWVYYGGS